MCQTARVPGWIGRCRRRWAVAGTAGDPRSGQDRYRSGDRGRVGRGLRGRYRAGARQPQVFGLVASDPTVSRLIAVGRGRAGGGGRDPRRPCGGSGTSLAARGGAAPGGLVVIDLDATLITAHSTRGAAPTWKKTFGLHPLLSNVDHGDVRWRGAAGRLLRAGNAGSNTAADHVAVFDDALTQLPPKSARAAPTASATSWCAPTPPAPPPLRRAPGRPRRAVLLGAYLHHFDTARHP